MPKFRSCGVDATLTACDLHESLSDVVNLRMGEVQQKDAKRIEKVLAGGVQLTERPIGEYGSETDVLQYIGENKDMPLFIVEAGDELRQSDDDERIQQSIEMSPSIESLPKLDSSISSLAESPLTPLAPVPISGSPFQSFADTSQRRERTENEEREDSVLEVSSRRAHARKAERLYLEREQRALTLTINTSTSTHVLNPQKGQKIIDQDLKIEVFFNGRLSMAEFINTRRNGTAKNSMTTSGTRIHRQIEKPWVYSRGDALSQSQITAEERWEGFSRLLVDEVAKRGVDKWGNPPPTGEFLKALSRIPLPDRLKHHPNIGVIDLLVTTGSGSKHAPSTGYITSPSRMGSEKYHAGASEPNPLSFENADPLSASRASSFQTTNAILDDPFSNLPPTVSANLQSTAFSSPLSAAGNLPSTSSDVPLAERPWVPKLKLRNSLPSSELKLKDSAASLKATPLIDSLEALQKQLSAIPNDTLVVKAYVNSKGKSGKNRPVSARIGDIKQMRPEKRDQAVQELREDLVLLRPKTAVENVAAFREELALMGKDPDILRIKPFTNRRGKASGASTLDERLGHIKKMTAANSFKYIQELREDFGMANSGTPNQTTPIQTPSKGSRKKSTPGSGSVLETVGKEGVDMPDASPLELDPNPPTDHISMLAQGRMDMAMDFGASPKGRLADRIASLSPHRTPTKKTPTPSKETPAPRNTGSIAGSPRSLRRNNDGSRMNSMTMSLRRDSPRASVTGLKGLATEQLSASAGQSPKSGQTEIEPPPKKIRHQAPVPDQTPEQALASFKIPDMCQGSAISYAGGDVQRQVTKSRPGSFEEAQVVVGMRFVVI